jgi:hypothetical protein
MADTIIQTSYQNVKKGVADQPGYVALDHYPFKGGMNFQAADFPLIAGNGKAAMLGNNQAFFFVRNPKGNSDPAKLELDTSALKKLIGNIYDQGTQFSLLIDADVFRDRAKFVDKYQHIRPEPDEATRRAMLGREAEMIAGFVEAGGIPKLIGEVIQEKTGIKDAALEHKTMEFLQHGHFKLQGVTIDKPIAYAVWQVDGPAGALIAKQVYPSQTPNTERPWQLGTEPELAALKENGHAGASALLDAAARMKQLPKINLTLGDKGSSPSHYRE